MLPSPRTPSPSTLARNLLLAGVLTIVFLGALHAPFIGDDRDAITLNPGIHGLLSSLSPPTDTSIAGRPITSLSLALNYALGGLDPRGYHALNLLLHVANTLLVGSLAHRLVATRSAPTTARWMGLLTGLLWGLHPLNTEVVAYVVERTESLAALAIFTVLWMWERAARTDRRGWALAAVLASLLGMGCKEHVMLLPLVVLLMDRTFWAGSFKGAWRARGATAWLALFATSAWALHTVVFSPRTGSVGANLGVSRLNYLLTQSQVIWHYLALCFVPFGLQHKYRWAIVTDPATVALPFAGLVVLAIATVLALRRWPVWGMTGAWFFLWLAPSSSFFPIVTEVAADRRMYLPLLAVLAALGMVLSRLFRARPSALLAVGLAASIALGLRSVDRLRDYRDTISLSESLLRVDPDNLGAHQALGPLYYVQGQPDRARTHLLAVLEQTPANVIAHYFLARIALDEGNNALAAKHLEQVVNGPGAPADAATLLKQAKADAR